MLLVISPAKTLDFSPPSAELPATSPELGKDTAELARVARRLSARDLKRLMGISDKLATLNVARFRAFTANDTDSGVQAALAFAGDVYVGLQARSLDPPALQWAQDHLRILSGLYGVLRPLDRIQPYRLEMGVRLQTRRGSDLYSFWRAKVSRTLNQAARSHTDPTLVNLASQEYFGAVDRSALKLPLVTCLFKEEKDGEIRTIALYAKVARGLMARYAIDGRLDRAEQLKAFDRASYRFRPELSSDAEWVFVRAQPQPKGRA
jgi:cytoplasmic iron level regulating protein YaaA (DUF328/UPF0246 family)